VWDLLLNDGTDADATNLLEKGKLIAVPVVNPDGYDLSRSLVNEQKRKNCRIAAGVIPTLAECTASANANRGVDPNRNYLPFWGAGSSTSATASSSRGEAPGSEPEIAGMIDLLDRNQITVGINNHTPDQRLLRAPSSSNEPDVVADQAAYQGLLERLSGNLPGWPRARGRTSTTRPPAPPSSRPITPTARSASRPRRRRASAARRRSTRPIRT
jgi:hypothetical protein